MPLREAALQKGIFIGSEANYDHLMDDKQFGEVLGVQYNLMTAGNACKWQATEPQYNEYNFTQCDYCYNFAVSKNMTFRGHNLCWGNSNPKWLLNGSWTPSQLQQILENHITTVMQHKPLTNVYCWDVVNEAVSDNVAQQGLFKPNVWYPVIPDYVNIAFQTARKANPNTKLFYNDYNILMDEGFMKQKSDAVYNMTKSMLENKIPLDGIGMQTHLNMGEYPSNSSSNSEYKLNYTSILNNLKRFDSLGLEIHITEMDIVCGKYENGSLVPCQNYTKEIETQQAEMYQMVLKACLQVEKCKSFESWGYTDRYTWRGTDQYQLPFDVNLEPKTAAYYIENELLS